MSTIIAVSGKGGVGKTTISGLLVKQLIARDVKPVLAIDADPNTCLDGALGVTAVHTVGGAREEARDIAQQGMSAGISKQELLELKINESLIESDHFDLIAMGRPEGPGCYCYANNVLKAAIGKLTASYPAAVLDNEAGLENLSRRIVQKVDLLVLVADPSQRGLDTIQRLYTLSQEMNIEYRQLAIVINRLRKNELPQKALELKNQFSAAAIISIPNDDQLADFSEMGENLLLLPTTNPALTKIDQLLDLLA
jgi:CO dehydrogenase maturation factor